MKKLVMLLFVFASVTAIAENLHTKQTTKKMNDKEKVAALLKSIETIVSIIANLPSAPTSANEVVVPNTDNSQIVICPDKL